MTITLGTTQHWELQRLPRQNAEQQHANVKLITRQQPKFQTIPEVNRDHINYINQILTQAQGDYFGMWADDVRILDPYYLTACTALLGKHNHTACGLPCWSLGGYGKKAYPSRVWIAKTRDCKPVEYDNLSDKSYADAQIIWLIDQGLNGLIVNTEWNHWVPANLTYLTTPGYVLEEYNKKGEHWANPAITLHTKPGEKLNIHPLLNPKP